MVKCLQNLIEMESVFGVIKVPAPSTVLILTLLITHMVIKPVAVLKITPQTSKYTSKSLIECFTSDDLELWSSSSRKLMLSNFEIKLCIQNIQLDNLSMVEEKLNFCLKYFSAVIKRPHESRDCTCEL